MIDEYYTFLIFGYHSDDLSDHSGKRIVVVCDECCKYRAIQKFAYRDTCHPCSIRGILPSTETLQKSSDARKGISLSDQHRKKLVEAWKHRPPATDETRSKMRESAKNRPPITDDTRELMRAANNGENNRNWRGGHDRRRPWVLPVGQCIKLNDRFDGAAFHHITKSIGVFIPEELHNHVYHELKIGKNMGEMNMLALQFINGGL